MLILKRLLAGIVLVVAAIVAVAYLLPREVSVARTVHIDAPAERVFPHVATLKAMAVWSPWLERDPNVALTYDGPETGAGQRMSWTSEHPQVGSGSQVVTAVTPDRRVETALDFGPMGAADAWLDLVAAGEGTDVTWGFTTDLGMNPVSRWMGLMMDRWVGGDYEAGLARLKALVESG